MTTWNTQPSTAGVTAPRISLDYVAYIDRYSSSLADAVADISSTVTTLVIDDNVNVTANVTVPSTLTLWFMGQGKFTVSAAVTCTINGPIVATQRQIFAGSGTVTFASNRLVHGVCPEWWGAIGDDSTDCATAYNAAVNSLGSGGGIVLVGRGTYVLGAEVGPTSEMFSLHFIGCGVSASILKASHSAGSVIRLNRSNSGLRDVKVTATAARNSGAAGLITGSVSKPQMKLVRR